MRNALICKHNNKSLEISVIIIYHNNSSGFSQGLMTFLATSSSVNNGVMLLAFYCGVALKFNQNVVSSFYEVHAIIVPVEMSD